MRHAQLLPIEPAKAAYDSCHVRLSLLNFITLPLPLALVLVLVLVLALAVILPNKQKQEQE